MSVLGSGTELVFRWAGDAKDPALTLWEDAGRNYGVVTVALEVNGHRIGEGVYSVNHIDVVGMSGGWKSATVNVSLVHIRRRVAPDATRPIPPDSDPE